jgi:hypothetical protein
MKTNLGIREAGSVLVISLLVLFISLVSSFSIDFPEETSTTSVSVNTTQFDSSSPINIRESWLTSFISSASYEEADPLWSGNASSVLTSLTAGTNISISGSGNSRTIALDITSLKSYLDTIYQVIGTYLTPDNIVSYVGNWSADKSDYYTKTNIDSFNYYNSTDFEIDNYYLKSNPYGYYNSTDFSIANYYTSSQTDTAISNANTSIKNYADNKFLDKSGDTMTGHLNISSNNITTSGSGYIYSNSTCIIIKGSSSILEIC